MLYAVQVRDMHTAIHNLLIYRRRTVAVDARNFIRELERYPGAADGVALPVEVAEINFRKPPTEWKGERLTIVNGLYGSPAGVPDAYPCVDS